MKSIVYERSGGPEVLRLVERELPEPGPGEVRVRVAVSGVNPADWQIREGRTEAAGETTPHQDGAGIVDAVGEGVAGLAKGVRVWMLLAQIGRPTGTAQEYTVLPADRVVPLPAEASFDEGASLGVPALTAHRALTVSEGGPTRLEPGALEGHTVLVTGGAGAVGHAAIQLARWAGATVITTVSNAAKAELARRAGAHHLVNYREGDPAAEIRAIAPDGVDTIVEVDVAANSDLILAVLRRYGTVAAYAFYGLEITVPVRPHQALNTRLQFIQLSDLDGERLRGAIEDTSAALVDGALAIGEDAGLPITRYALEDTADAQEAVRDGFVGKVLVDVADLEEAG